MAQCQATTQSGDSCSRKATDGEYCFQHAESGGQSSDASESSGARDRAKYDPDKVAEAIRKAGGAIQAAADMIGCSHDTVHRYCKKYDVCRDAKYRSRHNLKELSRQTIAEALEKRGSDVAWKESIRAAIKSLKMYDTDTEPKKLQHSVDEEDKEEALNKLLGGDG